MIMTMYLILANKVAQWRRAILLGALATILIFLMFRLCDNLSSKADGLNGTKELLSEPFSFLEWAFLVFFANAPALRLRWAAKVACVFCYLGYFFNYIRIYSSSFDIELSALVTNDLRWKFSIFVFAFLLTQALIWLTGLIVPFGRVVLTEDGRRSSARLLSKASWFVIVSISMVFTFFVFWFSAAFGGAGHGVYGPITVVMTPFTLLQWPVLVGLANSTKDRFRFVAKLLTCLYYLWFSVYILHRYPFGLAYDFKRLGDLGGLQMERIFVGWAVAFLAIHCLIWIPSIYFFKIKNMPPPTPAITPGA